MFKYRLISTLFLLPRTLSEARSQYGMLSRLGSTFKPCFCICEHPTFSCTRHFTCCRTILFFVAAANPAEPVSFRRAVAHPCDSTTSRLVCMRLNREHTRRFYDGMTLFPDIVCRQPLNLLAY
ncbi:hypothetical protein BC628DRAFT_923080 [Trametes gibbosa]|nr:hypothetical protein BC628DRAFT_923080 [Trametes gibbosa]